ncbi:MAG: hypothetical protein AAFU85_19440 [Planctomycetota bacterium]
MKHRRYPYRCGGRRVIHGHMALTYDAFDHRRQSAWLFADRKTDAQDPHIPVNCETQVELGHIDSVKA